MKEDYHIELQCQLDTGAMCSVMSLRDLAVIMQTGDPPLKSSEVKLRLFDEASWCCYIENTPKWFHYTA